jgi:ribosomal protein S18 acetylase RimI-like enzyme
VNPVVHDVKAMRWSLAETTPANTYSPGMHPAVAHRPVPPVHIRAAEGADVDRLVALEQLAFSTDRMSRRSFRRFVASPHAALIVAERADALEGYALVLFREGSDVARLYSIAVAPHGSGRGLGKALLEAAEAAVMARGRTVLRLEVHERNAAAIRRYERSGYRRFGRHRHYYADRGHALRYEKRLTPSLPGLAAAPPYVQQTTEFTCGPACVMMALAWAEPGWRPSETIELQLWREATTIFMSSGPGGCEPYGLALALQRRGLRPEIHVERPGPYFLDTVRSDDQRRVMRLAQDEFHREAEELHIATRIAPLGEPALVEAFDSGAVAIVLVAGYHMVRRGVPHWVLAFGHDSGRVLVHDPAAVRDGKGAPAPATWAIPWATFRRVARFGRDHLTAAIIVRKGPPP